MEPRKNNASPNDERDDATRQDDLAAGRNRISNEENEPKNVAGSVEEEGDENYADDEELSDADFDVDDDKDEDVV